MRLERIVDPHNLANFSHIVLCFLHSMVEAIGNKSLRMIASRPESVRGRNSNSY